MLRLTRSGAAVAAAALLATLPVRTSEPQAQDGLTPAVLDAIPFRNFGPFRAGAWITDFAVPAAPDRSHRYTVYVGTRNGGLWKTENGGTTFRSIFDATGQWSIGAVAVAPSDERVVWAGTGESFVVRYSYPGNGVYKSTDAGETWQHMGLAATRHIARILIHPTDPNTVYVASMGPLHTTSPDRGVYRTRDGGRTWDHVLAIDNEVGVIELVMNPKDPAILYAAAYDKERTAWRLRQGGPGSGIYKTTDAGGNWTRLEGGLPTGNIGRIGLDVFRANPDVLYAVVENLNPRPEGLPQPSAVGGGIGEVYRSDDAGRTWRLTHDRSINVGGKAPYSFNWLKIDPGDDQRVYVTSVYVAHTSDGGRTWQDLETARVRFRNMFGDIRAMWVDPDDPQRLLVGSDGGVYETLDGGRTIRHYPNLPLGEVYAVAVDMDDPYHLHAGLQDHESWRAPVNGFAGSVGVEHWVTVGTGDGMYNAVDPTDSAWVYNTQQFGGHFRHNLATGERTSIVPPHPKSGPASATPGRHRSCSRRTIRGRCSPARRWCSARAIAATTWEAISPDLSTARGRATDTPGGPCTIERVGDGNIWYCTITSVAESPHTRGVIWAATDDGRIHVTRDDGARWTDVTAAIGTAGAPQGYWFTRVVPSRHAAGRAFATITGFHRDDDRPFVYRTDDYGASWRAISASLPAAAPANVIVEDPVNASLLFLGTDIHPREHDLVVGTHGRGVWVADITPLQQMSDEVLARDLHLFAPEAKGLRIETGWGNYRLYGDQVLATPNEPNGMPIVYWQRDPSSGPV
jgi:photosystem II stability/assembly factor-like uncharacterized protein